ncbi:MFS transporter [Tessaracoccus aquimaris]|uniref:MFS transporter n=1 Tax=Tessaracoccus aquimaris TaxID=1332264 RepID=UPI001D04D58C|nr:MFS transporter [Tessaracoccus aquimaris]
MSELSTRRRRAALLALALGGFGIGATEFVAMGLLPQIARSLLPELWASSQEAALARGGLVVSGYALGVVIGAFTVAVATVRLPRKVAVTGFAVAFTIGSLLSAAAPTFWLLVAARFVAALAHGAYFGFASLIAAAIMGPGNRGKGIAMVLSGLTVANVIGVPLITMLGQRTNWRVAYLAVAVIFAIATVAIAVAVPRQPGNPNASIRGELRVFRRPQVWLALAIGAIGFGGFFAVYSYVSPIATELAGLSEGWVPIALVVVGVGMTLGVQVGGRLADRGALRALINLYPWYLGALVVLALFASEPWVLMVFLFLMAALSSAMMPAIQTRLLDVSGDAQTLASALNHASLNIGNSLGAALGGLVISIGLGFSAPAWAGAALGSWVCCSRSSPACWSGAARADSGRANARHPEGRRALSFLRPGGCGPAPAATGATRRGAP